MFFSNRIRLVQPGDRVLEIGPGSTPHPRSDIFLERHFPKNEAERQRGYTPGRKLTKPIVYYDGGSFPFHDQVFDYVICSHVLEHVSDVELFCNEMFRVAKRGYVEFPTVYYEYLYNFTVHIQLLSFQSGELRHMPKISSGLNDFLPVQRLFYQTLEQGYSELVEILKKTMFQGFEWKSPFPIRRVFELSELAHQGTVPTVAYPRWLRFVRRVIRWLNNMIGHS